MPPLLRQPVGIRRWIRRAQRSTVVVLLNATILLLLWPVHSPAAAAQRSPGRTSINGAAAGSGPRDFRSKNFLLHTDLPTEEAEQLLQRLETMLGLISKYWGKPNREPLECYVVQDLSAWPANSLHPLGREKISQRSGVTVTQTQVNTQTGRVLAAKAVVYAIADRGTPQHEAVHAYCGQNFGHTGPIWYSEGMAEMGQYWRKGESRVNCIPEAVQYLRRSEPKSLNEIVNASEVSGDSWENYCWRWALCHLLANNPNYYDRFRPLGLGLLQNRPRASFEEVYGTMAREISFEYLFFLQHFDLGYEVTLTSWDWKTKFRRASRNSTISSTIHANRGWQASRVLVSSGEQLNLQVEGSWSVSADHTPLDATGTPITTSAENAASNSTSMSSASGASAKKDSETAGGDKKTSERRRASKKQKSADQTSEPPLQAVIPYESEFPRGQLIGVLLQDYELSEPFALPASGLWTAPAEGQLFLRCEDAWNELADNDGKITVQINSAGAEPEDAVPAEQP
jgi:hypothetical protein